MEVFRLTREQYARSLSGKGAALKGARWNSVGVELIYSATNRSLAMAEVAVHFTLATLPDDYRMVTLYIPDTFPLSRISLKSLPENWNAFPYHISTQTIGDKFVRERSCCILKTPSAVTKGDFNFLLNPAHPDFARIKIKKIEKFPFDKRIFG
ncbi:MAG: RES family NAD+ phosphorylase [Bacteroidia bacterium]|jgi:RES domain-containing protein